MADDHEQSEGAERATSPSVGVGRVSESLDTKMMEMYKIQQESNIHFQNQIMQILSTMANAQAIQSQAALQSASTSTQAQIQTPVANHISEVVAAASSQIRLTSYDPDDTPFTMVEWMDDVTKIQQEFGMSDTMIVLKAGHALRGRAARFFQHWKPISRDWVSFRRDFEVAFPERGTPATRIRACLEITSDKFVSLVEYGNAKLSSIKRFYPDFPWNIRLSLVEYDIKNIEVRNRICLKAPTCDADLLKLLATCDATVKIEEDRSRELSRKRGNNSTDEHPDFKGKCRKCHRYGHKQANCKQVIHAPNKRLPVLSEIKSTSETTKLTNIKTCNYCKKIGHTEDVCFSKHGMPKRVLLSRFISSPSATLANNNTFTTL